MECTFLQGCLIAAMIVTTSSCSQAPKDYKTDKQGACQPKAAELNTLQQTAQLLAVADSGVTYDNTIKALLDSHCVGCHGLATTSGGVNLVGYQYAKANGVRAVFRVSQRSMPP